MKLIVAAFALVFACNGKGPAMKEVTVTTTVSGGDSVKLPGVLKKGKGGEYPKSIVVTNRSPKAIMVDAFTVPAGESAVFEPREFDKTTGVVLEWARGGR